MATPLETYNNSQERQNSLKWQNATINDVANKYGFDFSKSYAERQAEAVAAEQRNAQLNAQRQNQTMNKQNIRDINSSLKSGVIGTENNFFQTYLRQRQQQANSGLNSGLQADQDLRLGMNQQSVLADLYRDAGNNKAKENDRFSNEDLRIRDALSLIEKQKQTEAEKLYQDLITKGYGMLGTERSWYNTLDQQAYGRYQDEVDLALRLQQMEEARAARAAQERAAKQAAAQQQAALNDQLKNYQAKVASQPTSALGAYYSSPAIKAVEQLKAFRPGSVANKYLTTPVGPANDRTLSAYDKLSMFRYDYGGLQNVARDIKK